METKTHSYPHTPISIAWTPIDNGKGYWNYNRVEVYKDGIKIGEYTRTYSSFTAKTFHPFQLKDTWYAFYSQEYTALRVARLTDVFEDWCGDNPDNYGFCPVEVFVPRGSCESFAMHDGTVRNYVSWFDAEYKSEEEFIEDVKDKPIVWADYAFLSGCIWGDDSSWKLRYLDISDIENKVVKIEERFGYWELACNLDIRESVRIFEHGSIHLTGAFQMNLNKKKPSDLFCPDFFGDE